VDECKPLPPPPTLTPATVFPYSTPPPPPPGGAATTTDGGDGAYEEVASRCRGVESLESSGDGGTPGESGVVRIRGGGGVPSIVVPVVRASRGGGVAGWERVCSRAQRAAARVPDEVCKHTRRKEVLLLMTCVPGGGRRCFLKEDPISFILIIS